MDRKPSVTVCTEDTYGTQYNVGDGFGVPGYVSPYSGDGGVPDAGEINELSYGYSLYTYATSGALRDYYEDRGE